MFRLSPVSLASACTSVKTLHFSRVVVAVVTTTLQAFNLVANGLYLKADMAKVKKHTTAVETSQIMDLSFFSVGGVTSTFRARFSCSWQAHYAF